MKALKTLFVCFFLFGLPVLAAAHPPTEVDLSYDLDTQKLSIDATHLTHRPRKDYLKKFVFYVNGKEVKTEYNQFQVDKLHFKMDEDLPAEEGDVLSVKIYSSDGGSKTATLTVKKKDKDKKDQEKGEDMKETSTVEEATMPSTPEQTDMPTQKSTNKTAPKKGSY